MRAFRIEGIEYGWFVASLDDNALVCSNVMDCDDPRRLLQCLGDLFVRRRQEAWTAFAGEPGAVILRFTVSGTDITATAWAAKVDAWDLPDAPSELPGCRDDLLWETTLEGVQLLDAVVTAFALYADGNGLALYRAHWGEFSRDEFEPLKRFALTVSHGRESWDEDAGLFCASFLEGHNQT